MNYVIYLIEHKTNAPIFLNDGNEERIKGFLKFWKLYRPFAKISIFELDGEGKEDVLFYEGETKDAPINF